MVVEKIKNFLSDLDYFLLIPTLLLCGIGLLCIYSATVSGSPELQFNFTKQLFHFAIGLLLMFLVILIPIRLIDGAAISLYAITVVLLILVLATGSVRYGAQRWFALGPFSLQPSEIAKIATMICIARMLALSRVNPAHIANIIITFALTLIPMFLVMKQPDLGTALCIGCIALPILYWHGISLFSIFVMFSPIATVLVHIGSGYSFEAFILTLFAILMILYFSKRKTGIILAVFALNIIVGLSSEPLWDSLKDYQKERILNFIEPERDTQGSGYQVRQSKIAIGAGGFSGKGLLEGTQTQLKFLPEQHTDFIFSVVGEEFGFIGAVVLLTLFGIMIFRIILIADVVDDKFASLTLIGIATLFSFQVMVNIGMTTGIMPVTGIPLPFLSYGGTALWTNLCLMGIALNISMRKKVYDIH
ncbi:rod shape-determining protein RodA [bacterium]|nr:MAG: rod shape-determining protein RodA [bacterium]